MKRKFIMFIFGLLLAAVLSIFLGLPQSASAKTTKVSVTTLETSPVSPQGLNDWYTSVTMVKLKTSTYSQIYFQWNSTEGEWSKYEGQFRAWQGENTLYYYSVYSGVKEAVKAEVIKVDYIKPETVELDILSRAGQAKLSWLSSEDKYKVYRQVKDNYQLIGTVSSTSFTDTEVKVGESYNYAVVAIDKAGLSSKMAKSSVTILEPVKPVAAKVVVKPEIGKGATTAKKVEGIKPEPEVKKVEEKVAEKAPEKVEPKPENTDISAKTNSESQNENWNKLLVAISILIIAAGAAIGGYYGYEWWATKREDSSEGPKSKNRW